MVDAGGWLLVVLDWLLRGLEAWEGGGERGGGEECWRVWDREAVNWVESWGEGGLVRWGGNRGVEGRR